MAVTGVPTDDDNDDFCIPADSDQFNNVFKEPFPGQYEWSVAGHHFICVPWDEYNAYFNRTIDRRLIDYPEKRYLDNGIGQIKARTKACGSSGCMYGLILAILSLLEIV